MFPKEPNPNLKRVEFALRATGVKLGEGNSLRSGTHTRGYLPHVKREGASYFVTFRLDDSLPKEFLLKIQHDRAEKLRRLIADHSGKKSADAQEAIERDYRRKLERELDRGIGNCHLKRKEIGEMVAKALRYFEGKRYLLDSWVIMPNHVHALVWPMPNHDLSMTLKNWKGYTAYEANKILNQTGTTFWQPESYDHWIRNETEKGRIYRYIIDNPVKIGLCSAPEEWPWSSAWKGWQRRQS